MAKANKEIILTCWKREHNSLRHQMRRENDFGLIERKKIRPKSDKCQRNVKELNAIQGNTRKILKCSS
jgi:hypothetical protein